MRLRFLGISIFLFLPRFHFPLCLLKEGGWFRKWSMCFDALDLMSFVRFAVPVFWEVGLFVAPESHTVAFDDLNASARRDVLERL